MKKFASAAMACLAVGSALVGCGSSDDDGATPQWDTAAAPVAQWDQSMRGIKVPAGDDGPSTANPVPHGWAPSPQGAVMAAINAQAAMATAGEEVWPQVAQLMLAPGQGRDQWAQARSLMDIEGEVADPPRFVGFRFSEFSEEKAVVLLATEWPDGKRTAYPVQMVRMDDWRVVMPVQGQAPDLVELSDEAFAEFTPFGA
ncbi:hypothetical protein [Corynebacterium xerosis]|uniref:hypothetical protein n=1 Tax=Corynebacterium xerosis TaxID=1725 RepID=UPI00387A0F71